MSSNPRTIERVVVVEDDAPLRRNLALALEARFDDVKTCRTVADLRALLETWWPDLMVLDFALPDGTAFDAVSAVKQGAMPTIIAISGTADPCSTFELAQLGVRQFLSKPFELAELDRVLQRAIETPPDIEGSLRSMVGHRPLKEVEEEVRAVMVREAVGRSKGSRRGAARTLQISRQLLQHILRWLGGACLLLAAI